MDFRLSSWFSDIVIYIYIDIDIDIDNIVSIS